MDEKANSKDAAADGLRVAEDGASAADFERADDGLAGAREGEENAGGLYTGVGRATNDGKGKAKGFWKRKGPMGLILGLILGGGGLMMGSQSLMPMAIEEMIIEKFNSIGISTTIASDAWLDTQLNQGVQSGSSEKNLYAFSSYQIESFKKQGLYVVSGEGVTAILYLKNGAYIPVVGSKLLGGDTSALVEKIKKAGNVSNVGTPVSAATALADPDFKNPYTTASKSWRGGSSGWFDKIMSNITETKLSINRNRWTRWVTRSITDFNSDLLEVKAEFDKTAGGSDFSKMSDGGVDVEGSYFTDGSNTYPANKVYSKVDDNGKTHWYLNGTTTEVSPEGSGHSDSLNGINSSGLSQNEKLEKVSSVLNSKAVQVASKAAEIACGVMEAAMTIYTVAETYQNLQFLNLISGFLESVDKVKAGAGDGSPVHEYSNNLSTAGETKDSNGKVLANKNAMQSAGIAWLFGGGAISRTDASVQNVNFESIMNNLSVITKNVGGTVRTFEYCGYVRATTAAIDLASTIISIIPIIGQGFKAFQVTAKQVIKAAVKAAVSVAVSLLVPLVVQRVAQLVIKNAATEWFGEDLGNALVSGASKYLGGNGTSGGQSPGSRSKVLAYLNAQETVIAEEAKYQRSVKSPFDASSPYTFLGTLVYAAIPMSYMSSGVISKIAGANSLVSNALIAMLPTASALSENDLLLSSGKCDLLETTGAIGDAFCNPYVITDTSTIGISPVEVSAIVHEIGSDNTIAATGGGLSKKISGNFDSDGKIKKNSNLAKYLTYCGQRTSQYGFRDANIAEQVAGKNNTVLNIMGKVPVINNISDIIEGLRESSNYKWTTGQMCVASDDSKYSDWDTEYRYYQRYAENERLLENMNPGYKSPVTAYLEQYYEENPVDNSLEGQLARFSGMTKEDVSDTLALIEYYQFLAQYDVSERYAFGMPAVEEKHDLKFDNENQIANNIYIILLNDIEFADVRNRSFVV